MKKTLFLLFFISSFCFSQINFEKGYFITNSGEKIECYIQNVDWRSNPTTFEYRLSEDVNSKTANMESIREFGILDSKKFVRAVVNIDRSSDNVSKLSDVSQPEFKKEQLFLEVLVDGKANLYRYQDTNLIRYFYKTDDSGFEQLVYKKFITPKRKVGINQRFKQHLWNNFKCGEISRNDIEALQYNQADLTNFFLRYNKCMDPSFTKQKTKKSGYDVFNLTPKIGLNSSSLAISNEYSYIENELKFDNKIGAGFGIEAEFVLPFNKNKWALLFEPYYYSYQAEKRMDHEHIQVNYSAISFLFGARHYMFLNNATKIFVNAHTSLFNIDLDKEITFADRKDLDIKTNKFYMSFGVGVEYKKYSVEFRYAPNKSIMDHALWGSDYKQISLLLGYSIL